MNIFSDLLNKKKIKLNLPPAIFFYSKENLIDKTLPNNFCIPETCEILKNEYPFVGRSIFFKEINNLDEINNFSDKLYSNKQTSSSHFLSPFIHEWTHSLQLDYIYKKFGYSGDCEYMQNVYSKKANDISGIEILKKMENKTLSKKENEIIFEELGEYSTLPHNQYLEVFAETITKFICNSLQNCQLKSDPFEKFNNTHKEFQKIFHKVCTFE